MSVTALHVAAEVLQTFRRIFAEKMEKQDVPPSVVLVFAAVAANEGRSLKELQQDTGLGQAVMSRACTMLGRGKQALGEPGLGLLNVEEDPTNYSRKIVTLTDAGRGLIAEIDEHVGRFLRQRPGKAQ
ncbi:hypothetical protein [Burkholderia plantarii]|uniref:hypothetical protein n=1 Tax=Burkholderia plantarii TaxID=41899 RepID=UPI0018DC4B8B|nr:hypothetical protein [Burkholderia plantarii]MBI0327559.1 hypothetical protein [Burkholderia plantarii]